MCGLCGVLGNEGHWADGIVRPGQSTPASPVPWIRRQARQRRIHLANVILRHYRVKLSDWQGTMFLLTGPTGRTEIADNLTDLWRKAEAAAGRPIDPLDPDLLNALSDDP